MDDSSKDNFFQNVSFANTKELNDLDWSEIAIDCCDHFGNSLLHYACAHGNTEAVLLLLGRGAAVDLANAVGWLPVHQACRYGHIDVVRLLSRQKAGLSRSTALGASCIALAVAGGHLEVVEFLVSLGARLDESPCGFPLVTLAAHRANLPCLRYLVSRCSLEAPAEEAAVAVVAPLEAAVAAERADHAIDACRLLLAMGADPGRRNAAGAAPVDVAMAMGRTEVAQLLQQHRSQPKRRAKLDKDSGAEGERRSLLGVFPDDPIEAVKHNNADQLREMLAANRRALLDFETEDGATPLMYAAMMGHATCCRVLLEAGCEVDKQDDVNGWTALMQAIFHNQKQIVRLLLNHRANSDLRSKNDLTALDIALLCEGDDNKEIVTLLSSEKSLRNEHRRMWRRLEDLGLSESKLDGSSGSQLLRSRSRLWGAMTRRWRLQTATASSSSAAAAAAAWRGSSSSLAQRATTRFSAALAKLSQPFRRRVRFREDTGPRPEAAEAGGDGADVLPAAPTFRPPQMDVEEVAQGIREIRAALHAELDLNELSTFTKHPDDTALRSPLLSGSSSTLVASSLSLSASTSTLQASRPSSTSSEQGGPPTLSRLLQKYGCEHVTPIFLTHEVDLESFECLSENDLREMDIQDPQTIRTLLDAITARKSTSSDLGEETF